MTKSLNAESKRNQALEEVNKDLGNLAADLETSIMFTTAGIFNPQGEQMPFTGEGIQCFNLDVEYKYKKSPNWNNKGCQAFSLKLIFYLFRMQGEADCKDSSISRERGED